MRNSLRLAGAVRELKREILVLYLPIKLYTVQDLLPKNAITFLSVTTGFLVSTIIRRIMFVCLSVRPPTCKLDEK